MGPDADPGDREIGSNAVCGRIAPRRRPYELVSLPKGGQLTPAASRGGKVSDRRSDRPGGTIQS